MKPDTQTLLAVAAELRAAGATWEAVARRVGREPSTCRKWPSRYGADWVALEQVARSRRDEGSAIVPHPAPTSNDAGRRGRSRWSVGPGLRTWAQDRQVRRPAATVEL